MFFFIPIHYFLLFSFSLFGIGILGIIFNRHNLLILMLYVELTFFASSFNFAIFSKYSGDASGQIIALLILAVAAADAAIGLGLLINHFQLNRTISYYSLNNSKG
jgi:NADH-quinone oxidoreductase subunit K